MDLTLSFGGVDFHLSAYAPESTSSRNETPIVCVKEHVRSNDDKSNGSGVAGIVAELSNFTGELLISMKKRTTSNWNELTETSEEEDDTKTKLGRERGIDMSLLDTTTRTTIQAIEPKFIQKDIQVANVSRSVMKERREIPQPDVELFSDTTTSDEDVTKTIDGVKNDEFSQENLRGLRPISEMHECLMEDDYNESTIGLEYDINSMEYEITSVPKEEDTSPLSLAAGIGMQENKSVVKRNVSLVGNSDNKVVKDVVTKDVVTEDNAIKMKGSTDESKTDKELGQSKSKNLFVFGGGGAGGKKKSKNIYTRHISNTPVKTVVSQKMVFHELCSTVKTNTLELDEMLMSNPSLAGERDSLGLFPIHYLLQNAYFPHFDQDDSGDFIKKLIKFYPDALLEKDKKGNIPFVEPIIKWIGWVHECERIKSKDSRGMFGGEAKRHDDEEDPDEKYHDIYPRGFEATPFVEWILDILSWSLEHMVAPSEVAPASSLVSKKGNQGAESIMLAGRIASIPHFVRTILLIDNSDTRDRIMKMSIFKRVAFREESISNWLVDMIESDGIPAERAVVYLEYLSTMTFTEFARKRQTQPSDYRYFMARRSILFSKLSQYETMIPSLLVLDRVYVEKAATTLIVHNILNQTLAQPFIVSLMIIDLVLTIVNLIAFRALALSYGIILQAPNSEDAFRNRKYTVAGVFLLNIYMLMRELSSGTALAQLSWNVCISSFRDMWRQLELVKIICVFWSLYEMNAGGSYTKSLLTFTILLTWLSLFNDMKSMKSQLATYILSITFIITDVFWFLVIMLMIVFMTADLSVVNKANTDPGGLNLPGICITDDPHGPVGGLMNALSWTENDGFCTVDLKNRYFKNFAVMLGDFSYEDDYSVDNGSKIIFALLGILVIVIFLNIMIALVTEAYLKCQEITETVFGTARLKYTSERIALQISLAPRKRKSPLDFDWWGTVLFRILFYGSVIFTTSFVQYCIFCRIFLNYERESFGFVEEPRAFFTVLWITLSFFLGISTLTFMYNVYTTFSSDGKEIDAIVQKFLRHYPQRVFLSVVNIIGLTPEKLDIENTEDRIEALSETIEDSIQLSENRIMGAISVMEQRLAVKA